MVQSEEARDWKMLQLPTAPPAVLLKTGALPPLGLLKVVAKMRLGLEGSTARLGSLWCPVSALLACGIMLPMLMVCAEPGDAMPARATNEIATSAPARVFANVMSHLLGCRGAYVAIAACEARSLVRHRLPDAGPDATKKGPP